MRDFYDVVVVGSGFGGASMACRLAQAHRSVCVLERGRRWRPVEFPRSPLQLVRDGFWELADGRFGFVEYRVFRGMHVIQGSGVGGGSLHYFNVHARAPEKIFADRRWPASLTRARLDPYYDVAEVMLDAAALAPPAGRELPLRTTSFQQACRLLGREPEPLKIAVYTGPGRRNPHGAATQLPCDYSGNCGFGCAAAAKNTLDLNYLPLAERQGAEIHALHHVDCIAPLRRGGYRVDFQHMLPQAPSAPERGSVRAGTVFVAAGTLGTNELLLRCRDQHATLPRLGPTLGHGFSGNGDMLLAGALTDHDIDPGRGPSITSAVDFSTSAQQIYVEDLGLPDMLLWFIEGMLANTLPTLNLVRWGKIFLRGRFGIAGVGDRLSHERERLLGGGRTCGLLPYLGMCEDAADGRFVLTDEGQLDLRWDPHGEPARARGRDARTE